MYDSASCSYAGALDLKGPTTTAGAILGNNSLNSNNSNNVAGTSTSCAAVKQENWPYRGLGCGSTFQQLKQSVEKAKQALADRGGYLAGAFSPPPTRGNNNANSNNNNASSNNSTNVSSPSTSVSGELGNDYFSSKRPSENYSFRFEKNK